MRRVVLTKISTSLSERDAHDRGDPRFRYRRLWEPDIVFVIRVPRKRKR